MPGSIEQREQAAKELRTKNLKDIYELPPELQIAGKPVRIFNLTPMRYQRSMGSYGQWTIHAAREGFLWKIQYNPENSTEYEWIETPLENDKQIAYGRPTEVPYITNDPVHVDMFQMAHRHDSGRKVARDILGMGQFHSPGEDLTRWGCFIAEGEEPTIKELKAALKMWHVTCDALITEADTYWNQGPSEYKNVTEMHRLAAQWRNQRDKPWCRGVIEMTACNICGNQLMPAAALCTFCRTVFDEERVIKARVVGYEYLWAKKGRE